jgi:DNA modification methylase
MKIYNQDCLYKLKELKDNSVDSIVTDPPYGLSFMGKKWDYDVPSVEIWVECLRVLKSGGHLLSFASSRTYHRMAVRIEDAGFEIRDQIMWIYGSGFPKSMNISKQIDKKNGQSKIELKFVEWYRTVGISAKETNKIIGTKDTGSHYLRLDQPSLPTKEFWEKLKPHITIEIPNWVNELIKRVEAERDVIGNQTKARSKNSSFTMPTMGDATEYKSWDITRPSTDEAKQYEGWGTALKPAHEPIVMARKPFKGTVVNNVLEWGTGGINIDESRVGVDLNDPNHRNTKPSKSGDSSMFGIGGVNYGQNIKGRFPANIILDKEAGKILDQQSGVSKSSNTKRNRNTIGSFGMPNDKTPEYLDKGGASRFFYCPKTSKRDRNEGVDNNHPTVKPTDLMLYLIRLVTPKGGTTLDPFMGSGSSGKAAVRGGFDFIGIEREKEYIEIAKARIKYEQEKQKPDQQQKLF